MNMVLFSVIFSFYTLLSSDVALYDAHVHVYNPSQWSLPPITNRSLHGMCACQCISPGDATSMSTLSQFLESCNNQN